MLWMPPWPVQGAGQEVQLTPAIRKGGSGEPFQRGNSDVFTFKSLDVGDVSHVTVRLVRVMPCCFWRPLFCTCYRS
jgi:hypothetical protein